MATVYKLICNCCGEFYVGATTRPLGKRFSSHKEHSKIFPNRKIYSHMKKHDYMFRIEKIKDVKEEDMLMEELKYYNELKPTLNNNIPLVLDKVGHKKEFMRKYEHKPKRIYYNKVIRKQNKEAKLNLMLLNNLPFNLD